ncbi:hypothetical protein BCR39DRAFT_345336 [Naematelia encephala]|uniref:CST complex subunit Stn1 N-terminal domain-containing protein n=1 Tax=Naematelia encephala TaxID=71784 RepID=A0A1Y2AM91_9TREE|nr:hypothetical protein BCR39DRAFT_345336 [Naematelia encephala]
MTTLRPSPGKGQPYTLSSVTDSLPPLATLLTWVHRPQAVARCFVSDVYQMASLVSTTEGTSHSSRDVFLLNRFPCRMVELVGWVAGVDNKEASMVVTLDDGDGQAVLPITVRLSQAKSVMQSSSLSPTKAPTATHFSTAQERKKQRKAAAVAQSELKTAKTQALGKVYERKDVRVGDTVRVVGKVDEWMRRKAVGSGEWVRQVVVEEGTGGSIDVVDPDEQYIHAACVLRLHEEVYSQLFTVPALPAPPRNGSSLISSPAKSTLWSDGFDASSEAVSELSMDGGELRLCDPKKLRSSQLTDVTFRQYLLDYMNQETTKVIREAGASMPTSLESLFPEYRGRTTSRKGKEKAPLSITNRHNTPAYPDSDPDATPTVFRSRKARRLASTPSVEIEPFTIAHLLAVPHLQELASLVVESEARKEERRRRRRIRDGFARPRDLEIEEERRRSGRGSGEWRLSDQERWSKMERLVAWVIRGVAEEGGLVQLQMPHQLYAKSMDLIDTQDRSRRSMKAVHEEFGYLPLPPPLLFPLIVSHIQQEHALRANIIMRRSDPRCGNGMTVDEVVSRLRSWGEEGRWERLAEWTVREALEWGEDIGELRKVGNGWWISESD